MKELRIDATLENLEVVTNFINEQLEAYGCPMKAQMQIDVAVEEVYTNIVNYAYDADVGDAVVSLEMKKNPDVVVITFIDSGKPYNPLMKENPDITLSAEERQIGGLGIFMVKKLMDELIYKYDDKKNILEIRKNI